MKTVYKKIAAIVIIFLLIYVCLFYIALKPKLNSIKDQYKTLITNQNQLASFIAQKENLAKLQKDEERIDKALNLAQNIIPKQKQTSDFLIQIEAAARQTGLDLKSVNIQETTTSKPKKEEEEETTTKSKSTETTKEEKTQKKSPYQAVGFSITTEGDFKHFLDFLTLTESLARYTALTNISITSSQNNNLQIKIDGEVYYK